MGLFGNLNKSKKQVEEDQFEIIKKDKRLYPLLELILSLQHGDQGEIMAAVCKTIECIVCSHKDPIEKFLKPKPGFDSFFEMRCPKCGKAPIFFGWKSTK